MQEIQANLLQLASDDDRRNASCSNRSERKTLDSETIAQGVMSLKVICLYRGFTITDEFYCFAFYSFIIFSGQLAVKKEDMI